MGGFLMGQKMNEHAEKRVWYAIQTFYCKEKALGEFLTEQGLNCFIPMQYTEQETPDGKKQRVLTPAVRNLLFIEKTLKEEEILSKVKSCPIPSFFVRNRETNRCYEIPDYQMVELRAICDPDYTGTLIVDSAMADARPGQNVRVIRGNFTGLEGKLTQYKKRYYVVIKVAMLGVMLHIPKWYCERIE